MSEENPVFFCLEGQEILHDDIDSALEYIYDQCEDEEIPETATVEGYDREEINETMRNHYYNNTVENFVENFDDDFRCNLEFNAESKITEEMRAVAKEFVDKMLSMLQVGNCVKVSTFEVKVDDYYDRTNR